MKAYSYLLLLLFVAPFPCLTPAIAQENSSFCGKLADQVSREAVVFANVALFNLNNSRLNDATISDTTGYFYFTRIPEGNYRLQVNIIGYEEHKQEIVIGKKGKYEAGIIYLKQNAFNPGETFVTAERVKGRSEKDRTTYFITGKMADISTNGIDVVKLIPGIRVDLRKNISLEGSENILILVDGKERDNNFISQIKADMIDKVEIMSNPPAKYDGTVTGVVNVILKKEEKSGTNGQVNLELPLSGSVYLHPDYNLSVIYRKLSFFTSYNGEIIRFDQQENLDRSITAIDGIIETGSHQRLEQRLWSHRFHYGIDYFPDKTSQFSFYGYYNPYSQEYEGVAEVTGDLADTTWKAVRSSENLNRSVFNSLFFKHEFDEKRSTLELDLSNYIFSAGNTDTYTPLLPGKENRVLRNESRPLLNATTFKSDFNVVTGENSKLSAGLKLRSQRMEDSKTSGFDYSEKTFAAYSSFGVNRARYEWTLGIRVEKSSSELKESFRKSYLSLLPSASVNIKLEKDKSLKLAVNSTIRRPDLYQLNPILSYDDPSTVHSGNPLLNPEIRTSAFIEYNRKLGSNFLLTRLFYNRNSDVISNLTEINDTSAFETGIFNLGIIHQGGIQFSGTFKAGSMFNFVPYLRVYDNYCDANNLAEMHFINNKNQLIYEPGLSAIAAFRHDINLSLFFQYSSPKNSIQWRSFGDAFYSVSLEKTFKKAFKASITSGLPLTKRFVYQGSEANGPDFISHYSGEVIVRNFMMSFKLSYQFRYGRINQKINHPGEETEVPRKVI